MMLAVGCHIWLFIEAHSFCTPLLRHFSKNSWWILLSAFSASIEMVYCYFDLHVCFCANTTISKAFLNCLGHDSFIHLFKGNYMSILCITSLLEKLTLSVFNKVPQGIWSLSEIKRNEFVVLSQKIFLQYAYVNCLPQLHSPVPLVFKKYMWIVWFFEENKSMLFYIFLKMLFYL